MTCKECVHYEVCKEDVELHHDFYDCLEVDGVEKHCEFFKPKSRFVELPCEVGQTVYVDCDTFCFNPISFEHRFIYSKHFLVGEIVSIIKTKKQLLMKIRVENSIHTRYKHKRYTVNAIGVTVFLSREEAEKALKEREKE